MKIIDEQLWLYYAAEDSTDKRSQALIFVDYPAGVPTATPKP